MKLKDILNEKIEIDVEIGDTILTGRFKNKKTKVNSIETDQHGMPTINGRKVTTFRTMKKQDESTMMKEGPQRDRNNMALYIIDLNNTLSNAKVLAKKDPKYKKYIKFIEKDIKDAKEKLAKMKYIKFLDADDVILGDSTNTLVNILENNPKTILAYGLQRKVKDIKLVDFISAYFIYYVYSCIIFTVNIIILIYQ